MHLNWGTYTHTACTHRYAIIRPRIWIRHEVIIAWCPAVSILNFNKDLDYTDCRANAISLGHKLNKIEC